MARLPPLISLTIVASLMILVPTWFLLRDSFDTREAHTAQWAPGSITRGGAVGANAALFEHALLKGDSIMPKLGNATAKAELGRASWKLLHTMAARFPEKPTASEREALKSFIYLFARLYPCGECAAEFQALLEKHPPQTSSRSAASFHLCHVHNLVNERLGKPEFDCSKNLEGIYDCGCGADEAGERTAESSTPTGSNVDRHETERADGAGPIVDPETGFELVGG